MVQILAMNENISCLNSPFKFTCNALFKLSIFRSVGRAWQSLKAELRYRSETHSKLAGEVC